MPALGYRRTEGIDPRRAVTIECILQSLPGSRAQIIARSGYCPQTVFPVLAILRAERRVHISKWERDPVRGNSVAIFSAGDKGDVPNNTKPLTRHQKHKRYAAKIAGTERADQIKARQRNRHWLAQAVKTPRTWLSALGVA